MTNWSADRHASYYASAGNKKTRYGHHKNLNILEIGSVTIEAPKVETGEAELEQRT